MASVNGVTTYFDIQELVAQALEKEREPLDTAAARKSSYSQAKTDWQQVKSALLSLKTSLFTLTLPGTFYSSTATSSDADIITATASAAAAITSYRLTDITLAQAARRTGAELRLNDSAAYQGTKSVLGSTASIGTPVNPNLVLSDPATNISTEVGGEQVQFQAGALVINGATIAIDPAQDTLYEVIGKINSSTAGVTASLVKEGEEYRLRLESKKTGDEEIAIDSDTTNFVRLMRLDDAGAFSEGKDAFWEQTIDYVNANHPDSPLRGVKDGYFMINGISFSVDSSTDTLQSVINKVNNSQAGVSMMYDKDLDYVTVTAKETGDDIVFGDSFGQGDTSEFLKNVLGLDLTAGTVTAAHTKASVTVNGTAINPDANTFTLNGTTFTLHADSAAGANVEIGRNTEAAKTAIQSFVDKYNKLSSLIDEKRSGESLRNDRLLSNMRSELRTLVLKQVANPGEYSFLREIGVEYDSGKLSLDTGALDDAFRDNPDSVGQLFGFDSDGNGLRNDGGFANATINDFITGLTLASTGDISQMTKNLELRIEQANTKMTKLQKRLIERESQLTAEYTRLATASSEMARNLQTMQSRLSALSSY